MTIAIIRRKRKMGEEKKERLTCMEHLGSICDLQILMKMRQKFLHRKMG